MTEQSQQASDIAKEAKQKGLDPFSKEFAQVLDVDDTLGHLRSEFNLPAFDAVSPNASVEDNSNPCTYLCGNSLGLMSKRSQKMIEEEMEVWAKTGVQGHWKHKYNRTWFDLVEKLSPLMARIVGANEREVAIMNSLTVNLHLLMASFYKPTKERSHIMYEYYAFPSDQFAFQTQARFHSLDPDEVLLPIKPRDGEYTLRTEDILEALEKHGKETALVIFSGIQFYTGQFFDIPVITKKAKEMGCVIGWDLAHAAGNVSLKLHDWKVDFACWCTYKYLNSGPGGIGGIFVHESNFDVVRLAGWWGNEIETRFSVNVPFKPSNGAQGFQISNPSVLNVASLYGSLETFALVDFEALRAKSIRLSGYLELLLDRISETYMAKVKSSEPPFRIITPRDAASRGAQISVIFPASSPNSNIDGPKMPKVFEILLQEGVIGDSRQPDVIRLSPAPLYNTFSDVYRACMVLDKVMCDYITEHN